MGGGHGPQRNQPKLTIHGHLIILVRHKRVFRAIQNPTNEFYKLLEIFNL